MTLLWLIPAALLAAALLWMLYRVMRATEAIAGTRDELVGHIEEILRRLEPPK